MQNYEWEMMAQFIFPAQLGIVEEVISVDIKPRWQEVETGDSIRLTGIYHIMAVVRFNPSQTPRFSEGTFIEHIEFDGNNGYFEYALPFEVDLPREKIEQPKHPRIDIEDLSFFIFDGSSCLFKWDAHCVLNEQLETPLLEQMEEEEQLSIENDHVGDQEIVENIQQTSTESLQQTDIEQFVEVQEEVLLEPIEEQQHAIEEHQDLDEVEEDHYLKEQDDALNYLESIHLPTYGELIEQQQAEPTESIETEFSQQERIVEAKPIMEKQEDTILVQPSEQDDPVESNTYLPTDTDDFYNQLTESYTVLKLSNNIIRE